MGVIEHQPPSHFEPGHVDPVLFLAGPIQGALDWQSDATEIARSIWQNDATLHVVNPRWAAKAKDKEFVKDNQITWEKTYLKRASILGGIVFYLAGESPDAPSPNKPGRAYAQTTRKEFGRAAGWKDYDPGVVFSIGMEAGYTGNEDYYRHTADEFDMTVHDNLEDTVTEAITNIKDVYRFLFRG